MFLVACLIRYTSDEVPFLSRINCFETTCITQSDKFDLLAIILFCPTFRPPFQPGFLRKPGHALRKSTWIGGRNVGKIKKIIARRSNLSAWFETWWQMLRNNMSSKTNRLVSLPVHKLPLWLSGVTWPGCLPLRRRHLECGVALRVYPQWLKYLSKAPFVFSASVYFCLSFRPLGCHLLFPDYVSWPLTHNI